MLGEKGCTGKHVKFPGYGYDIVQVVASILLKTIPLEIH
jgi:hypothetical protein